MDVAVDLYLALPLLFTVLAVILASVFVKLRATDGDKAAETAKGEGSQGKEATEQGEERKEGDAPKEEGVPRGEKDEEGAKDEGRRIPVEEIGAEEGKAKRAGENEEPQPEEEAGAAAARTAKAADKQSQPQEMSIPRPAAEAVEEEEEEDDDDESKEEDQDWEKERLVVNEPDLDDAAGEKISFKYSPGKLRGNQYKTMMTKEELEEEQRTEDYMKLSLASS
ncbi:matrix-remodeling-associated protein 7 isoform 3-T3 [Pangshura tecta]